MKYSRIRAIIPSRESEWNHVHFVFRINTAILPSMRTYIRFLYTERSVGRWNSRSHENDCHEYSHFTDSTSNINRKSVLAYPASRERNPRCRRVTFDVYTLACILSFCRKKRYSEYECLSLWWNISTEPCVYLIMA